MQINPKPISFIIRPETLENVAIRMIEYAEPVSLIINPLTVITRAIAPVHFALAVSESTFPFACVNCPCFVSVCRSQLSWLIQEVFRAFNMLPKRLIFLRSFWRHCFFELDHREILAGANLFTFHEFDLLSAFIASSPSLQLDD